MTATKRRPRRRAMLGSCAALALAALAAGCGGDDDTADAPAQPEPAKPVSFPITATAEGATKRAMAFPSSVRSGLVTMTLRNTDTVPRSAQLLRIVGNHTLDAVVEVVTGDGEEIPAWVQDGGGVPAVAPGAIGRASQVLAPGRYVLLDDEEGEGENAKSHAELGAVGEFTVTGERGRAGLPAVPATITATDAERDGEKTYGFRLEGLKPGTNQVHVQNTGAELHHALFAPLRKGATLAQAEQLFRSSRTPSGPPPVDFSKIFGTKVIDAGIEQNVTLDIPAGRYAVICFISDREGGKSHVEKGMIEEVTVE